MNTTVIKVALFGFIFTLFFIFNLSYKGSHNGVSFVENLTKSTIVINDKEQSNVNKSIFNLFGNFNISSLHNEKNNETVGENKCVVFGPIAQENKNIVDKLFTQAEIKNNFSIIEQPVYEIYWNLGKNKLTAIEIFETQKNSGALKDEKYKLSLDNDNNYIVYISKILADENLALSNATDLAVQANKAKVGGKWQYKTKSNVYFYQTNKSASIPKEVNAVLEKTFGITKSNCK
jgi:hypothetical protein